MFARVPESMASIRCDIGWPISTLTPGSVFSLALTSATTSFLERLPSSNGASISETLTPSACSSSSARPVFRATVFISGTVRRSSSALRPTLSDSSSDTPGRVLTLIVNEPSLNAGRKLLPRLKKIPNATANRARTAPKVVFLWEITHSSATL